MKKKKRGSTMVMVVITMAIIFLVGTTVLGFTSSTYKRKVNESKRMQNLYEADSGLDVVENIIIKASQEAIKYADTKVKEGFAQNTIIATADKTEKEVANELFKSSFYSFLTDNKVVVNGTDTDLLLYLVSNLKTIDSVEDREIKTIDAVDPSVGYIIEVPENGYELVTGESGEKWINMDVNSNFETKGSELKQRRTVSINFKVKAPEYNSEINIVDIYPVFDGKSITADGNMKVEGGTESNLDITGDVWVKGVDENLTGENFTFDKYKGGIYLNNTGFDITGNIYTANTLHLENNIKGTAGHNSLVDGDVFAKNVYVGKGSYSGGSTNNKIDFYKDVTVNNDLAINSTNSVINLKNNFYGINDKTTEVDSAGKALNSSSIIVNEVSTPSELNIEKDAYIMGVAYLNATDASGNQYQTGESVAVKGNYLAYTDVSGILDPNSNATLKYYSPLQLLESINGVSNADMKSNYFANYFNNKDSKYKFNDGGVTLKGNVHSVGTSIKNSDGEILKGGITVETNKVVDAEREEYARNVFAMGDTTGISESTDIYGGQTVLKTVANQIDFEKLEGVKGENFNTDKGLLVLKGKNEKINIKDGRLNGVDVSKGLIISNSDIVIEGDFNFTGTIITSKDITFIGDGNKVINYSPQVVREVIASNYDKIKDIFNGSASSKKGSEVKINSSSELLSTEGFLEKSRWKIER
ncbi:pilus assembly PilX N-terminal domain-containing protein [Clostridium sartagoforme]|uniref:pilus assembly PilX N-terminal domain-containing protein n=1 Tax=Clostridium sartagoforme TaxID=84031 RepID=UPI001FAA939D|nr:pilus assembly PilX N-terminal domain-containing protein [Clostridium sartagoforme]